MARLLIGVMTTQARDFKVFNDMTFEDFSGRKLKFNYKVRKGVTYLSIDATEVIVSAVGIAAIEAATLGTKVSFDAFLALLPSNPAVREEEEEEEEEEDSDKKKHKKRKGRT